MVFCPDRQGHTDASLRDHAGGAVGSGGAGHDRRLGFLWTAFSGLQSRQHARARDPQGAGTIVLAGTLNEDFLDLLRTFQADAVDFVIVGAHALAVHGVVRATGDLDVFVRPTPENAEHVYRALVRFGAPLKDHGPTADDLARPGTVYQMGLPPRRVDVLNEISGPSFDEVWARRIETELGGLRVGIISRRDFLANKAASGRPKDLQDIQLLQDAGVSVKPT